MRTEARMVVVRSMATVVWMPRGMEASIDGSDGIDMVDGIDDVRARLA